VGRVAARRQAVLTVIAKYRPCGHASRLQQGAYFRGMRQFGFGHHRPDRTQETAWKEAGAEKRGSSASSAPRSQIRRAADRYGPESILVTSFSRAAAASWPAAIYRSRAPGGYAALHCWHALGGPELAEANVDDWNRDDPETGHHARQETGPSRWRGAGRKSSGMEKGGDELLQRLNRCRGLILPHQSWPEIRQRSAWRRATARSSRRKPAHSAGKQSSFAADEFLKD